MSKSKQNGNEGDGFTYFTQKELNLLMVSLCVGQGGFTDDDLLVVAKRLEICRIDEGLFQNVFAGTCALKVLDDGELSFRLIDDKEWRDVQAMYRAVDSDGEHIWKRDKLSRLASKGRVK